MQLRDLPNIGAKLEEELVEAGIGSPEELMQLGAKDAFLQIRMQVPDACVNQLYALAGAAEGMRWHHLSQQSREELKKWYRSLG